MPYPPSQQSYRVPNSEEPGSSTYYADNVFEILQQSVKATPNKDFLGRRPYNREQNTFGAYEFITYQQAYERILNIGSGLWTLADYAGVSQNFYSVALYDTLGADSIEYIMNHASVQVLVCSLDKVAKILRMREKLPLLKAIISLDNFGPNTPAEGLPSPFNTSSVSVLQQWAKASDIALYDLAQVEAMGAKEPVHPRIAKPDDIFCLCYTSGTTGTPKAAMIMHSNMDYVQRAIPSGVPIVGDIVVLSYLPLAHIYQRFIEIYVMTQSGKLGYFSGNILNVVEDLQALKPTFFNSVPRLLNRIYDRLVAGTIHAPGFTGVLARRAVAVKLAKHMFWDRIIFNKVRAVLGGNVQFVLTGSAPIDKKVLEFLRICFCCIVSEGWGQTESCGLGILNHNDAFLGGRIGAPQHGVEIKLRDIPSMNYYATDKPCPRGEMMVRGGNVFGGYYKDEKKTSEAIVEGGWLATGDVAQFNTDGTISIIDRVKNIFKLSQGEYVAPENLENVFSNNPLIMQMFVHGDSLQSTLVSVIVPDPETFVPWARNIVGNSNASLEELCQASAVNQAMLKQITTDGKKAKLQGYEFPKAIKLEHRPFDVEDNQILTPTLKLKRNVASEYYRKDIDEMYAQINNKA
ncbi:acetyl-CoA synthetase-like protein [Linderina pennispora]|uniref:Acetyl-CoA synthetase-like protein n=1 Tax=Linderina pennispora TaxID=61395 RepID=A0A1Y1WNA1_9FUNG|nr:acetyl-CoA synthetase-like protein [Linderina pennispora]ORX74594.1 acetyl-CoA synthetase-like protein [Linderina pennispora]